MTEQWAISWGIHADGTPGGNSFGPFRRDPDHHYQSRNPEDWSATPSLAWQKWEKTMRSSIEVSEKQARETRKLLEQALAERAEYEKRRKS